MSEENKIKEFVQRWKGRGREKQDTQTFWIELLTDVLGVEDATKRIDFEKTVKVKGEDGVERTKFIDAYIPETKVLIEQKDEKLSLNRRYSMSGTKIKYTPYEQGDRYGRHMNHNEHPRYIIACNFKEIEVHDNNHRGEAPQVIKLEDLERDYTRLSFLVSKKNEHLEREKELSVKAGRLVGNIYDSLLKMYKDPKAEETLKSLNILIVRLVFILYAEDAGIFQKQQFLNYMEQYRDNPGTFRRELITLFEILDTPVNQRDPYLEEGLSEFPYVNGGLFNKKIRVEIPLFSKEAINLILDDAAAGFDWRGISPTIFGATFESTLNPETRRSGGMHYTSLENIHKVIDPLFLDDLKE